MRNSHTTVDFLFANDKPIATLIRIAMTNERNSHKQKQKILCSEFLPWTIEKVALQELVKRHF